MPSEELARKLQRRLVVGQFTLSQTESTAAEVPVSAVYVESEQERTAVVNGKPTTELTEKRIRSLDIHYGTAKPEQTKVFNPYTEFKEFSRKQIKDMDQMFKSSIVLITAAQHSTSQTLDPTGTFSSNKASFVCMYTVPQMRQIHI